MDEQGKRSMKPQGIIAVLSATVGLLLSASPAIAADLGGSISGALTAEGTGAPLAGVETCAFAMEEEEFPVTCTESDVNGYYTIEPLAPGRYRVEFTPGMSGLNFIAEGWNDQVDWVEGDDVEVENGPVTGIDAEFSEGGEIHGRVVDAGTGAPLAGIWVCAFPVDTYRHWSCAVTGADGRYATVGNDAGRYKVSFVEDEQSEYLQQHYNNYYGWQEPDLVDVAIGAVTPNIDAALAKAGRITGTVTDSVTGAVIPGAEACAFEASADEYFEFFDNYNCATTGPAGAYTIERMPPGTYKVAFYPRFLGEGLYGEEESSVYFMQYFHGVDRWEEADQVTLAPGGTLSGIDAALLRRDAIVKQSSPLPLGQGPGAKGPKCRRGFRRVMVRRGVRCVRRCRRGFKMKMAKGAMRCRKVGNRPKRSRHGDKPMQKMGR